MLIELNKSKQFFNYYYCFYECKYYSDTFTRNAAKALHRKNCIQFPEQQSDSGRKLRLPTQSIVSKLAVCGQLCNKSGKNASNDEKTFSGSAETESLYDITDTANKIRQK